MPRRSNVVDFRPTKKSELQVTREKKQYTMLSLRVSKDLMEKLRRQSELTGWPVSRIVRWYLERDVHP